MSCRDRTKAEYQAGAKAVADFLRAPVRTLTDHVCIHCGCRDAWPAPGGWRCASCGELWKTVGVEKVAAVQNLAGCEHPDVEMYFDRANDGAYYVCQACGARVAY